MQFTVPQFIEHEPKIFGPFTFRQFVFIGSAGAICFILWFTLGKSNFLIFFLLALLTVVSFVSMAFVKVNGKSLPTLMGNFFKFSTGPKMYLWRKKETRIQMMKRVPQTAVEKMEEKTPSLKFAEKSRLKKLSTDIETGI